MRQRGQGLTRKEKEDEEVVEPTESAVRGGPVLPPVFAPSSQPTLAVHLALKSGLERRPECCNALAHCAQMYPRQNREQERESIAMVLLLKTVLPSMVCLLPFELQVTAMRSALNKKLSESKPTTASCSGR